MTPIKQGICLLSSAFCLLSFAACSGPIIHPQIGPSTGSAASTTIKSICLIEPHNKTAHLRISGDFTETLFQAIQKTNLFTLSILKQNDPAWANLPIRHDSLYTFDQLSATRKILGVDAILIGTVTSYSPYPNMAIGIQMKLIDLRDARVCWTIDQVWDTADKATEQRIKKYFDRQLRTDYSPLNDQLAILSSLNFLKFVTYDIAETL